MNKLKTDESLVLNYLDSVCIMIGHYHYTENGMNCNRKISYKSHIRNTQLINIKDKHYFLIWKAVHTNLSIQEREVISQLYTNDYFFTNMREINRNGKENRGKMKIRYSCIDADNKARIRKFNANHRRTKLLKIPQLYHLVYEK